MADVAVVVGRDAADVHADLSAGRPRPEQLPPPRLRVVQVQVPGSLRSRAIRGKGRGAEGLGGVRRDAVGTKKTG